MKVRDKKISKGADQELRPKYNSLPQHSRDEESTPQFWTKKNLTNKTLLFYNRYPKSGSTTFKTILSHLAKAKGQKAKGLGSGKRHRETISLRVRANIFHKADFDKF